MEKTDQSLIVTVPVADLRREPVDAKPLYVHDDLQETQVLYNEILLYLDEIDDWYCVEAMEQQKYTPKNIWQGYPGWIRKRNVTVINAPLTYNAVIKNKTARILNERSEKAGILLTVSIGTRFWVDETTDKEYYTAVLAHNKKGYISKDDIACIGIYKDESKLRKTVVSTGRLFIGVPYLWGGRSIFMPELLEGRQGAKGKEPRTDNAIYRTLYPAPDAPVTGVDCSGFTNLVYRVNNINIPRDAHGQWIAARNVDYKSLKPGDLIFVSIEGRSDFISHVMLNVDGDKFIETADTGGTVKINTFKDKFGESLNGLAGNSFLFRNRQIYFGRIISGQ
jgi:gamma-D-glutamyl-L-lysine dipeptidyl-peptidase